MEKSPQPATPSDGRVRTFRDLQIVLPAKKGKDERKSSDVEGIHFLLSGLMDRLTPNAKSSSPSSADDGICKYDSPPPSTSSAKRNGSALFSGASSAEVKVLGDYRLEKTIGEGAFGKVKLAVHLPTGQSVAIKVVEKSKLQYDAAERLVREVFVLKLIQHPHINRLLEVFDTPSAIYLVLEYVPGGELFDKICAVGRLEEHQARDYFRQLLSAVEYCHSHGVVHRDLKPENILIDADGKLKVIDFGFSNIMREGSHLDTFCGSAAYAAPEMLSGKKYVGQEVDIWSMGVILFLLVTGQLPFDDRNMSKLFYAVHAGAIKIPDQVSVDCKDLIHKMLCPKPEDRYTLQQIRDHTWTNDGGHLDLVKFCTNVNGEQLEKETRGEEWMGSGSTLDSLESEIIDSLAGLGFDRDHAVVEIRDKQPGPIFATYLLLLEKRANEARELATKFSVPVVAAEGKTSSSIGATPQESKKLQTTENKKRDLLPVRVTEDREMRPTFSRAAKSIVEEAAEEEEEDMKLKNAAKERSILACAKTSGIYGFGRTRASAEETASYVASSDGQNVPSSFSNIRTGTATVLPDNDVHKDLTATQSNMANTVQ